MQLNSRFLGYANTNNEKHAKHDQITQFLGNKINYSTFLIRHAIGMIFVNSYCILLGDCAC